MATEKAISANTFYKEKLADRLKDNCCENRECVRIKKAKYSERIELQEKLRRNEAAISTCEQIIVEKDKTIKESEEKLKDLMVNGSAGTAGSTVSEKSTPNTENDQCLLAVFQEISDSFTLDQLTDLCSFSLDSKKDGPFMTSMIKFSYKDMDALKAKSFTGRSKSNVEKAAISPEKLSLWKNMFRKRLQYSGTKDSVARLGKFRIHVNSSIQNSLRGTKISKIQNCKDEDRVAIIISNSENDFLVIKKIQKALPIKELKVLSVMK